jgi:hypothetical protein
VKRLTMLVTPEGRWVLEDSTEFLAALGDPNPDYDSASFAVKNLGFIKFQILGESVIEIELHPRNVELPALLAVQQQLLSSKVKLFRIRYLETSWCSEITSSSEQAISRLSALCLPPVPSKSTERFLVEAQDYSTLFADESSWLRPMVRKWRMSFGQFDPSVISFAIEHQLLSRIMIFGVKPRSTDPIFRFIGDGFPFLKNDYSLFGVGEKVQNQPDKDYGGWVSEFYKSVASTGQPRYDHISAAIQVDETQSSLFVTRYERLLLPWKTSSDEVFVSMMSKRLVDADVGEVDAAEPEDCLIRISAKSA